MNRTNIIAAFEGARTLIRTGDSQFICVALDQWSRDSQDLGSAAAANEAVQIVQDRIGLGHYTLESWVADNVGLNVNWLTYNKEGVTQMREYRVLWLNHLIQELRDDH